MWMAHFTSKHSVHSIHVNTKCIRFRAEPFHFILFSIKLHCAYSLSTGGFGACVVVATPPALWMNEWMNKTQQQFKALTKSQNCHNTLLFTYCVARAHTGSNTLEKEKLGNPLCAHTPNSPHPRFDFWLYLLDLCGGWWIRGWVVKN